MNNDRPETTAGNAPASAPQPRPGPKPWSWTDIRLFGVPLGICFVSGLVIVIVLTRNPSSRSGIPAQPGVVFDQTVSQSFVTQSFTLSGSDQTLTWSCDLSGTAQSGSLIIYLGAGGTDPLAAQPIFKGMCMISLSSGTQTLHIPPGSYFLRFLVGGTWHITLTDNDVGVCHESTCAATRVTGTPTQQK